MKTLKAICTSAILALALSVPAYAGEVLTPGVTPPPPPPPALTINVAVNQQTETSSDLGDIITPSVADILWILVSIL